MISPTSSDGTFMSRREYNAAPRQEHPPHGGPASGSEGGPPPGAAPPPAGAAYGAPQGPSAPVNPYAAPVVVSRQRMRFRSSSPHTLRPADRRPQQGVPLTLQQGPGPGYVPAAAAPPANGAYLPPQAVQPAAPAIAAPAPAPASHRVHHGLEHVRTKLLLDSANAQA